MLLFHYLLERVSEVGLITLVRLDYFVEGGIQFHDRVVLVLGEIFDETHGPQIVPVLRVVLQEPSIIVLRVQCGLTDQIGNLLGSPGLRLAALALIARHIISEELPDLARLWDRRCSWPRASSSCWTCLTKVKERALVSWLSFERIKARDLRII